MRNPNGYGCITKMSGKRRKPYRVRVTSSWTVNDDGRQKQNQITLGTYATKIEALTALDEYHKNPYDSKDSLTFSDMFDLWSKEKYPTISQSNVNAYNAAFKACIEIHDYPFNSLRLANLQDVVDNGGKNYPTLRKVKVLFKQLYKYAIQHDLCEKDYSTYVNIAKHQTDTESKHRMITEEERNILWNSCNRDEYVSVILILIYSGVRISELLNLKKENVHLDRQYFDILKSKTKAGKRKVPIADKVLPLWEHWMNKEGEYVIQPPKGGHFVYYTYKNTYFTRLFSQLCLSSHLPHDTRHTTVSMLTEQNIPKVLIQRIVGHKGKDITDDVYTHFELKQIIDAINRI